MSKMLSSFANKFLKIKMFIKLIFRLSFIVFALQILGIFLYDIYFNLAWGSEYSLQQENWHIIWNNGKLNETEDLILNSMMQLWEFHKEVFFWSCWIWAIIPLMIVYFWRYDRDETKSNEYIRGVQEISPKELTHVANKQGTLDIFWKARLLKSIPFGQVMLPIRDEIKQNFIVGKPGSGKTNAFNQMIDKIRQRKQKMILHDFKGDYVEKFYNPETDIIFNPLDIRSINWCLFDDCTSVMDIEGFAGSLIPDAAPGGDPFWNNAARDVMIGILRYCYANNKTTNQDIWQTCIIPNGELYKLLKATVGGERGAKHIEDSGGKTAASVMSNLMQYAKVFEYMIGMKGNFSITDWVENKDQAGIIYITNYAKLQHTLNPVISLFIQTVGRVLLSQSDDLNNRIFFFLDEFGQLQNLSTIPSLMTASRSKGGSVFIGIQDIGQIDKIYGKDIRTSILNSAANRIIFNCKDHNTAKFFSVDIGETEYYEALESQSLGMSSQDRINTSLQRRKELLIAPEDIQALPDLNALVSIGHYNVAKSKFKYKKYKKIAQAFIQRPELDLANVVDVMPSIISVTSQIADELEHEQFILGEERSV